MDPKNRQFLHTLVKVNLFAIAMTTYMTLTGLSITPHIQKAERVKKKDQTHYQPITISETECEQRKERNTHYEQQLGQLYTHIQQGNIIPAAVLTRNLERTSRRNGDDDLAQQLRDFTYTRDIYRQEGTITHHTIERSLWGMSSLLIRPVYYVGNQISGSTQPPNYPFSNNITTNIPAQYTRFEHHPFKRQSNKIE